jgi:hypothetical protein
MTDELKTETLPIEPMKIAVVSGTGTGDGGNPITSGTVATTPEHHPNLIITVVGPVMALVVRFINTFLTGWVGLLSGAPIIDKVAGMQIFEFNDLGDLVTKSAIAALAPAVIGLGKDLITIFGKLEGKYPLLTGNV